MAPYCNLSLLRSARFLENQLQFQDNLDKIPRYELEVFMLSPSLFSCSVAVYTGNRSSAKSCSSVAHLISGSNGYVLVSKLAPNQYLQTKSNNISSATTCFLLTTAIDFEDSGFEQLAHLQHRLQISGCDQKTRYSSKTTPLI